MSNRTTLAATAALAAALAGPAFAQEGLRWQSGDWTVTAHAAVSAQAAEVDDSLPPPDDSEEIEGSVRINADWTSASGLLAGANLDFSSSDRETEALDTGEIYIYVASELGRIEIGKQDGAADALALRAPVVALGQVRGDFARYAGSQALLSAYDSGDAPKIVYLSPPANGFRMGVSWAPRDERDDIGPFEVDHRDVIELGAQFEQPFGDWVLGASAGYVTGDTAGATEAIRSWSVGFQAKRGPLRLGGGFVDRGDSNQFVIGFDQTEWSLGAAWVTDDWGMAASAAWSSATNFDNQLFGVGGFYDVNDYVTLRADIVHIDEQRGPMENRGFAGVAEIEFHY